MEDSRKNSIRRTEETVFTRCARIGESKARDSAWSFYVSCEGRSGAWHWLWRRRSHCVPQAPPQLESFQRDRKFCQSGPLSHRGFALGGIEGTTCLSGIAETP